jgi:DnaJ-domain-containing protein 1
MSDRPHVDVLRAGPRVWNAWRRENPDVLPVLNDLDVSISERQFGRVQGGPIDLSLTELCRARLDQATLTEANLAGAALVDADLSDARLENADLSGANLSGANLAYASLSGARLHGADLRLAKGLTQAQIDHSLGDPRTALPAGVAPPRAWLRGSPESGQLVTQTGQDSVGPDDPDPYVILGVRPGASIQDIRAAWLKLVKELHPGGPSSNEARLKTINQAYQRLKDMDRQATQRQAAPASTRRNARAVFATFFLVSLVSAVVSIMVVGAWIYFTQPDATLGEAVPPARTSPDGRGETQLQPSAPRPVSGRPSTDEPAAGADRRLR